MFTLLLIYAVALSSSGAVAVAPPVINGLVAVSVLERTIAVVLEIK